MPLPELSLAVVLIAIASTMIGLLIMWLIIYSAVAAALRSHRNAVEDDRLHREHRAAVQGRVY